MPVLRGYRAGPGAGGHGLPGLWVTVGAAADPLDWTAPLDSATTAAGLTDDVAAAIARVLRGDVG